MYKYKILNVIKKILNIKYFLDEEIKQKNDPVLYCIWYCRLFIIENTGINATINEIDGA